MKNRKVIGATKTEYKGVVYHSKLEAYMAALLTTNRVPFEAQKQIELQPKIIYRGKIIRPIAIIIDFWLPNHNMILDTKGFATDSNVLKIKMLKYKFVNSQHPPTIEMPRTKQECENLVLRLTGKL